MKIGFIGTGTIAASIVTGLDHANYAYGEIVVSARSADISAKLAATCKRVRVEADNQAIVDQADILFLTVRPQVAEEVLSQLTYRPGSLVVSVVALHAIEKLQAWTGPDVTIVRAMPLPFVATCEGPTPIFPANDTVEAMFSALGRAIVTSDPEEFETIVLGSTTMGLYFSALGAIHTWLVEKGIDPANARSVMDQIWLNLAKTSNTEAHHTYPELRDAHSTRGGLNEQVWKAFDAEGGTDAVRKAMDAVYARVMPGKS